MVGRLVVVVLVAAVGCKQPGTPVEATATPATVAAPATAASPASEASGRASVLPEPAAEQTGHRELSGREPPADAKLVEYAADRRGFLYVPDGAGPFPVMVWNHGSERVPGWQSELAHFYVQHGWAFLLPHRRGHGRSPGMYIGDERDDAKVIAMQDEHNDDVVAAIEWVKHQPRIDAARVAVSGCSYGGIQTMITAARPVGIRAAVPFAAGAMRWQHSPALQRRLIRAASEARVPELLIQAENDYDLSPSKIAGAELERTGHGRAKIYPPFGTGAQAGHGFCVRGFDIWGPDVLAFLAKATR
ncbi:MAG: CocE/NonD family hydrolase [Kofleriaceae bacterium]